MKKIFIKCALLIFIMILSNFLNVLAQPGVGISFRFSSVAIVSATFPGGSTLVPIGVPQQDDDASLFAPAGMNLKFGGNTYQKFVVSTNGWVALVPNSVVAVPPSLSAGGFLNTNQLATYAGGYPLIAPFWDDLAATGYSYIYTANALWVRWTIKIDKNNPAGANLFYVRIDGITGVINFYYANNAAYVIFGAPTASIGIAGVCTGDYYSYNSPALNAWADSTLETSNIAARPNSFTYTFTPYQLYDNCINARDLSPLTGACTPATFNINNAISSGSTICATTDTADVWFKITKPIGVSNVTITTSPAAGCQPVTGTSVEVFSACGTAIPGACSSSSIANPTYGDLTVSRGGCTAEVLYIRVTGDGNAGGKFNICVRDAGALPGLGANCGNPNWICSLPFPFTGTTAGSGNDFNEITAACRSTYMNGEDYVFAYTPSANGCIKVDLVSAGVRPAVFVYYGCPNAPGSLCLGSAEMPASNSIRAVSLVAGQTYYIVVDNDTTSGNINNPFSITVSNTGTPPPTYDVCGSAQDLGPVASGITCVPQTFTTACATPTLPIAGAGFPICAPLVPISTFNDGVTGDVWLRFTPSYSGALQINTTVGAINPTSNAAMAVYTGLCGSMLAPVTCDVNSGPLGMPSISFSVISGTTYYIRVWSEHPDNGGTFTICFVSSCSPPNDLPCNAINVPIGQTALGFNTCATDIPASEPGGVAACAAGAGSKNSVWFRAVVPASGTITVKTNLGGTLSNTIIEGMLFPGGCALAATNSVRQPSAAGWCNNLGVACNGGIASGSIKIFTGLTPGDILYVAVDGQGSLTGTFDISFIDGSTAVYPAVPVQDCAGAQIVCSPVDILVPQPGYTGTGNICDVGTFPPCFSWSERNSSWYQFTVDPTSTGGTATISLNVRPLGSPIQLTLALWNVTGLTNACDSIRDFNAIASARCASGGLNDSIGLSPTGTGGSYDSSIVFTGAPRTFLIMINSFLDPALYPNHGYNLHFGFPIAVASSVSWAGAIDTLYSQLANWGPCGPVPTCATDAQILPTVNGRQPTIAVGTQSVRNLTIQLGATLTIRTGATLDVCGNFINNGNLICQPGSTIRFIGTGLQTISGFLTGANQFANLIISKASGSVQLLNDIDVSENFSTANNTSIFNISGKYMKVGGNFSNANGTITFTGIGGSTVEFYNSTPVQNFTNTTLSLNLNRVTMNKPAGRVNLTVGNSIMNIDSILTLTSGIISTRSAGGLEVNVKYLLPAAITGQNATSYIDGKLRRKISNGPGVTGSYSFPVGNLLLVGGYERAVIDFTTPTTIPDLLATFNNWSGAPPLGPVSFECIIADYSALPFLNNGYWTITRSNAVVTGNYNITLHNRGYTNNAGSNGYTVSRALSASLPNVAASWGLLGVCVPGSTVDSTKRDQINTLISDPTSFNHHYATVQTILRLPVELLYFSAEPIGEEVLCKWETATEINNAYFEVERSIDGYKFLSIEKVLGFGNGTSTESRKYSFVDTDLCEDIRYYRLKQVDINGDFTYSKPVAINCKRSSGIDLYPNPANTIIKYQFYYSENSELTVNIMDISGRIVRTEIINVQKGFNQITSRIDELAAGVYNLRITSSEKGKLMIQKQFFKN